jgi:hypothetical protein
MYRDEYERCPRCHVELIDAGAVRACTHCNGQWATHEVLMEMALTMSGLSPYAVPLLGGRPVSLPCPLRAR